MKNDTAKTDLARMGIKPGVHDFSDFDVNPGTMRGTGAATRGKQYDQGSNPPSDLQPKGHRSGKF